MRLLSGVGACALSFSALGVFSMHAQQSAFCLDAVLRADASNNTCSLKFGQSLDSVKTIVAGYRTEVETGITTTRIVVHGERTAVLVFPFVPGGSPRLAGYPGGQYLRRIEITDSAASVAASVAAVHRWERLLLAAGGTRRGCSGPPPAAVTMTRTRGARLFISGPFGNATLTSSLSRVWPQTFEARVSVSLADSGFAGGTSVAHGHCVLSDKDSVSLLTLPYRRDEVAGRWRELAEMKNTRIHECQELGRMSGRLTPCGDTVPLLAPDSVLRRADPPDDVAKPQRAKP